MDLFEVYANLMTIEEKEEGRPPIFETSVLLLVYYLVYTR